MKRAIGIVVALAATSCVVGAPPGFSDGNSWSLPLVGPLEDGQLVTPVWINDKGPYLFAIDTDSPVSSIDEAVVSEVKPIGGMGQRFDDEQDTSHPTRAVEILHIKIGDLVVRTRTLWVSRVGANNFGGRQIRGVIGRDVIADSLVFGFDRDKGLAYLATRKGFTPPPGAQSFGFRTQSPTLREAMRLPTPRFIATASVNGKDELLHVDLGAVPSQLREQKFEEAKLQKMTAKTVLVDEIGTPRQTEVAAIAGQVSAGGVTATGVKFVDYDDRRWEREDIDGTLGLGFFRDYAVWADWDQTKIYAVKRAADLGASTKERISRWGSAAINGCPHTGCVDISAMGQEPGPEGAPAPKAGPVTIHIQRDPAAKDLDLEVMIEAVGATGTSSALPRMVASLPAGTDTLTTEIDPSYAAATLRVVDVSPFVRACPSPGACLYTLGAAE